MPYYDVGRVESTTVQTVGNSYTSPQSFNFMTAGNFERGFRTLVPTGHEVKEIALNIAEPYSWFVDLQQTKVQALLKRTDFDPTLLRQDNGHTWLFEEFKYSGLWDFTSSDSWYNYSFKNVIPSVSDSGISSWSTVLPESTIEAWAAQQYGRMAPVVGDFSLTSFMGELREGLPRVLSEAFSKAKTLKGVGSDYLNVEFGWKPLVNDLQGIAESLLSASFGLFRPMGASHRERKRPRIEDYQRVDTNSTKGISPTWGPAYGATSQFVPYGTSSSVMTYFATALAQMSRKTTVDQWVEGEFVYIPKAGFDPTQFLDRFETLVNVDLTPAVLWELSPWSWLVDWYAQIGASLSAMEAGISNRILSTYFYGMEDAKATTTTSLSLLKARSDRSSFGYNGPKDLTARVERRRRRRIRGNPFGFGGSSTAKLNVQQMAILGALGLTKL